MAKLRIPALRAGSVRLRIRTVTVPGPPVVVTGQLPITVGAYGQRIGGDPSLPSVRTLEPVQEPLLLEPVPYYR